MAFAPTPPRNTPPSQLLSLDLILAATAGSSGQSISASVSITSQPTSGTIGAALSVAGAVFPAGTAVSVGLSSSASAAPISWTTAIVSGTGWSANLTPSASGIYYLWAEQSGTPIVQAVGAAVTVASPGSGLVAFTNTPVIGTAGTALLLAGTVSPSGTTVRVGLSASATVAPASWTNATVSGTGWTANVTPSTAGIYYLWAQQTNMTAVQAVSAALTIASSSSSTVAFTNAPTTGTAGTVMPLIGTVSPTGTAIRVGLSASTTVAPTSWTNAIVSGTGWTAGITPSAAGIYYLWAQQTNTTSVQAISAALTVAASGGAALSYSLIAGAGNGSMTSITVTTATSSNYPPSPSVDWTSSIGHGATDVSPCVILSSLGSVASCKFWFDTGTSNITVPSTYGTQSSTSNGAITFYPFSTGYGTPITAPAAPASAGTYYGKYAFYDASSTLLGVFVTSAITVS